MQSMKKHGLVLSFALVIAAASLPSRAEANALDDYNNGTLYFKQGNLQEALKWFDKSIAYRQEGFAEPYVNKGFCLQKLGYHDRAIPCYNEAIMISPKLAVAYQNRGTAYLHLNRFAESVRDLNKAISLPRPASLSLVTVYIDRGRAYAGLRKWKESFADFDYVLSMQPTNTKMATLREAAAEEKRKAKALMAQFGQGSSKTSASAVVRPATSDAAQKAATPGASSVDSSKEMSSSPTASNSSSPPVSSNSSSSPAATPGSSSSETPPEKPSVE